MSTGKKIGIVGVALLVLALAAYALSRPDGEAPETSSTLAEVERRTIDVVAEAAGLVEPVRVVEVKSNAAGEVLSVPVESGDRVARGALLAEINARDVQSALDQAAADLDSARVQLATAEAEQMRARRLRDEGLISPQEYEQTVEVTAAARASMVRSQATVRLAQERRQDVIIRAPIDGTILERTVEPGQIIASASANVSGGSTLFRMADLTAMQVRARVDEVDIGGVRPGQPARVSVEAYPGRTFRGTVEKIEPQAVVEQNITMFPVLVRLPNPEGLLRPGMNAEVTLEIASRPDVVAVPNAAVVSVREARAAAEVLGVDPSALRPERGGRGEGGRGEGGAAGGGMRQEGGARGEGTPGAERPRGGWRRGGGETGSAESGGTAIAWAGETRPAVLFVQEAGGPAPRRVLLGLSDWEYTEVVRGVEPGEQVVLVSVAQLQQRQTEFADRMRRRMSGPLGGGDSRSGGSRGGGATRGGGPRGG